MSLEGTKTGIRETEGFGRGSSCRRLGGNEAGARSSVSMILERSKRGEAVTRFSWSADGQPPSPPTNPSQIDVRSE